MGPLAALGARLGPKIVAGLSSKTALGLDLGLAAGAVAGVPALEAFRENRDRKAQINAIFQQGYHENLREARIQSLIEQVEQNTHRIMRQKPDVAQQILAGRRLPRGAVVIGGQPRTDLLEQVALAMAMNANQASQQSMGGSPLEGGLL